MNNWDNWDQKGKRVFISYAHEDSQYAQRLYHDFSQSDLYPWLDKENLLPGDNIDEAIENAIKKSDFFLPLFSKVSIAKRGYVQKEFKLGLDVAKSIPAGRIFIIPIRLDECEIPSELLKGLYYQDMFPHWSKGVDKILQAMGNKRSILRKSIEETLQARIRDLTGDDRIEALWLTTIPIIEELHKTSVYSSDHSRYVDSTKKMLSTKQQVVTAKKILLCYVSSYLDSGSQGQIYFASCSSANYALKWYYPALATPERKRKLEQLITIGNPNTNFLWPIDIAMVPHKIGFGFIMPLLESRFYPLEIIETGPKNRDPKISLIVCKNILKSFESLHSLNLCHGDISLSNIFFDQSSGEIRIGDNDNVVPSIYQENLDSKLIGTPRYVAPEILTGYSTPSINTDLHSIVVILFMILFRNHPFEGKRKKLIPKNDIKALIDFYGYKPVFIFDRFDTSNTLDPNLQNETIELWNKCPYFLKELFTETFTDISNTAKVRWDEAKWLSAFSRLDVSDFLQ